MKENRNAADQAFQSALLSEENLPITPRGENILRIFTESSRILLEFFRKFVDFSRYGRSKFKEKCTKVELTKIGSLTPSQRLTLSKIAALTPDRMYKTPSAPSPLSEIFMPPAKLRRPSEGEDKKSGSPPAEEKIAEISQKTRRNSGVKAALPRLRSLSRTSLVNSPLKTTTLSTTTVAKSTVQTTTAPVKSTTQGFKFKPIESVQVQSVAVTEPKKTKISTPSAALEKVAETSQKIRRNSTAKNLPVVEKEAPAKKLATTLSSSELTKVTIFILSFIIFRKFPRKF